MTEEQITETEYQPSATLGELLTAELSATGVSYGSDEEIELTGGASAQQRTYEMRLSTDSDEFELLGTETSSPIGMFMSFEGDLGFAAGIILYHARRLGKPTQVYADEVLTGETPVDGNQDLTAEWYPPPLAEQDIPEARLAQRVGDFEHTKLSIEELERYAQHWLS